MRPFSRLRRHLRSRERTRGQSLVEFALTLPIILLLTLIALDFGRVYLGYINLQDMTRVASNYAANHPDAWGPTPKAKEQGQYRNLILADAAPTNCQLPQAGGNPVVAPPVFTDDNGDGKTGLGDTVTVGLTCRFDIITPVISNILGNQVSVSAAAEFPVKSGMSSVANGGPGPIIGSAPVAAFSANSTISPNSLTVVGPTVDVEFRDTSGGSPTAWEWDFADGTTSTAQDPLLHTFTCGVASCSFVVTMKASNIVGSSTTSMSVVVLGTSNVNFDATPTSGTAPLTVAFTDTSSPGGTASTWDFGDGNTGSGATVTHKYTADGKYTVKLTVTYPAPVGDVSTTKDQYISVAIGTCNVPKLLGLRYNDAQGAWTAAGFTGTVSRDTGAPNGNFIITAQSIVYSTSPQSTAACNSSVQVH